MLNLWASEVFDQPSADICTNKQTLFPVPSLAKEKEKISSQVLDKNTKI